MMIGLVIPNILAFYELKLYDDYCKDLERRNERLELTVVLENTCNFYCSL